MHNTLNKNFKIPEKIILFFHDKASIPNVYHEALNKTKEVNSEYEIIYADDAYMHEFIRNKYTKDFLDIYKLNKIPASRSDLARLMLLFEYGGFYIDAAMEFKRPLKELINFNTEILLVRRDDVKRYENNPEMAHVINGIIASKPQSQYIEACIELAFSHLKSGIYNNNVWRATGPFVLNEILKQIINETIHIASFTDLLKNYIHYKRPKEVSNLWMKQQESGIMDLSYFRSQIQLL